MKHLYIMNSYSKKIEEFQPYKDSEIGVYVCGPTVYDIPHIGNLRSAIVYDMLYRILISLYRNVKYVRNVTDIDDKIITKVKSSGINIEDLTLSMEARYNSDLKVLNCLEPTHSPHATKHLQEMFDVISTLISNGYAYNADGDVFFDVTKSSEYGTLSNRSYKDMIAGARIETLKNKKNPMDFVLWKGEKEEEKSFCFDSPWGRGRPGWHTECVAMSTKYLGSEFDIHGGGADLMFPHHENEKAQALGVGHKYARYWVHNGFVTVNSEKMSKSIGNVINLDSIEKSMGVLYGVVIRFFYLSTSYRKPLDYSAKAISDAFKSIYKIASSIKHIGEEKICKLYLDGKYSTFSEIDISFSSQNAAEIFRNAGVMQKSLLDDMNFPESISILQQSASKILKNNKEDEFVIKELIHAIVILGLKITEMLEVIKWIENVDDDEILRMNQERNSLRKNKIWDEVDKIKQEIEMRGYTVMDLPNGSVIHRKI